MANRIKEQLKVFFQTNKKPTQEEFEDLIDSNLNIIDDKASDAEAQNDSIDDKFVTPKTAKISIQAFAPVKSVNGSTGNVTIPLQTTVTGNAGTATKLATPRSINGVLFDGSSDITIPTGGGISSNAIFTTDFLQGIAAQNPYVGSAIAAGIIVSTPISHVDADLNHPGQITLRKAAAANSGYSFSTYAYSIRIVAGLKYDVIFKIPTTTDFKTLRFGFLSTATTADDITNGVYFELNNGNLLGKSAKDNIRISTALPSLTAQIWYHCRLTIVSNTEAKFDIFADDSTLIGSALLTGISPLIFNVSAAFVALGTSSGVADNLCTLDYLSIDLGSLQRGAL